MILTGIRSELKFSSRVGDNWKGFPFLFALCVAASLIIWFGVDIEKGRRDAVAFAAAHRSADGTRIVEAGSQECTRTSTEDEVKKD